ncbi:VIT and vWA domain-containing protein [Undibacterium pigrum]|uniref:Ca-activated chloride channel family protein n=1 Tax=Undibacterium pigrum TaxID=401470 RepID=A0A318J5U3_9BURK|nr:VIT and VWA domain-containing protein [Undibacterium pigrum]PXX44172.1 Ca-activated chloride channel family protein [Undibacterium pigrum]
MFDQNTATIQSSLGQAMALTKVSATGVIQGMLLEMQLTQSFINPSDKEHAEVLYTFPLPIDAVLLDIEVELDGKKLSGAVVPRKKAEVDYEEAISEGNTAFMLQENGDRSFSLSIGNLAPGEACTLTMSYAQSLRFSEMEGLNALRICVPTVIAPRYEMTEAITSRKQNLFERLTAPKHDVRVEYPFDITLKMAGELVGARIASPSHAISVMPRDGSVIVSLSRKGNLDRDFLLCIDQFKQQAFSVLGPDFHQPEHVALLASFCPQIAAENMSELAVKLLVDCSGSMNGDSIKAARTALKEIVEQLNTGDHISLSRFGSEVQHRSPAMWKFAKPSKAAALRWIEELDASLGGTEMALALESTFAIQSSGRSDVLMITDGEIDSVDSLIDSARAAGQRVFIVGIGSSPAEVHLERLARASGGSCEYVAPGEDVVPAILRMFMKLRSPVWQDIRIDTGFASPPLWSTALPASVFKGETLNMFYLLPSKPSGTMKLFARMPDQPEETEIGHLELSQTMQSETSLSRVAAATYLSSMQAVPEQAAVVQELAVQYQLISKETSFLIVEERAEADKPLDMPALMEVAHMLPAGWGGMGAVAAGGAVTVAAAACPPCAPVPALAMPSISAPDMFRTRSMPGKLSKRAAPAALDELSLSSMDASYLSEPSAARVTLDAQAMQEFFDYANAFDAARIYRQDMHYQGLTPLGLTLLLRYFDEKLWPASLAGLKIIQLGQAVIEWLELAIWEDCKDKLSSREVVRLFLGIMAEQEMLETLLPSAESSKFLQESQAERMSVQQLRDASADPAASTMLEGQLRKALQGMDAGNWSAAIFLMDMEA